ncbi:Polycystin-2, partial [Pseudolycoriella hygida]
MFLYGTLHIYAGGGFHLDISCRNDTQELQRNSWITRGTRLVLLEFSLFNVNENIFCIVKLIAEIPATGGIVTSYSVRTMKLSTFINTQNYFMMFCEIVFLVMVC